MDQDASNFPNPPANLKKTQRRRQLLPWWVVGFAWLFMVFGVFTLFGLVLGLLHQRVNVSILGLSTDQLISLKGTLLILLFSFKAVTALALETEKVWAVRLAKIDAIISGLVCIGVMIYPIFFGHGFNFRWELVVIIPYYDKMYSIQNDWENFD